MDSPVPSKLVKHLIALAFLVCVLLVMGLSYVRLKFGGGELHPDVSTLPESPGSALEPIVSLDFPPGNVAATGDGRVIFAYHPFAQVRRFETASVFQLKDGVVSPFPNAEFQEKYQGVFGMTVDKQDRIWFVEPAALDHEQSRLLAFDLSTSELVYEHAFPAGWARFAQDLRVTPDGKTIVLADTGLFRFTPAHFIVFDIATREFSERLKAHESTQPQNLLIQTPFGLHKLAWGLLSFQVGVDGIALSEDGQTLYYASMSHEALYSVPVNALKDPLLSEDELGALVVRLGQKPLSDGIALDERGRVILTDVEHGGLAQWDPKSKKR